MTHALTCDLDEDCTCGAEDPMADPLFKATQTFRHVPESQKCARCGRPCTFVALASGGVSWRCRTCGVRSFSLGPDDDPGDYNDGRFDDPGASPAGMRVP